MIPYIQTEDSISIRICGKMYTIYDNHKHYSDICDEVKNIESNILQLIHKESESDSEDCCDINCKCNCKSSQPETKDLSRNVDEYQYGYNSGLADFDEGHPYDASDLSTIAMVGYYDGYNSHSDEDEVDYTEYGNHHPDFESSSSEDSTDECSCNCVSDKSCYERGWEDGYSRNKNRSDGKNYIKGYAVGRACADHDDFISQHDHLDDLHSVCYSIGYDKGWEAHLEFTKSKFYEQFTEYRLMPSGLSDSEREGFADGWDDCGEYIIEENEDSD